jgi:hypothetical protein
VVAADLGASEEAVRERVELLSAVLPDGGLGLPGVKPGDLVRLSAATLLTCFGPLKAEDN